MKILLFGRGVISTQYGWAFEKAGNEIEFYVRPGRSAEYGPRVSLNILDGRKNSKGDETIETWPITMRETIDKDHTYDLIIISVNHNQLEEAVRVIGQSTGDATILIFNNMWEDLKSIEANLPSGKVLWGFPGGGGGYYDLHTLKAGFMKTVFLENKAAEFSQERYHQVVQLFQEAGFSIFKQNNMEDWLRGHFLMNAAMAAEAMKVGGHEKAFQSIANIKEMIDLMREMVPLLKRKGSKTDMLTSLITHLPSTIAAVLLQKLSGRGSLAGEIMHRMEGSGHTTPEMNFFYLENIINDSKKYNIRLPKLMATISVAN